MRVYRVEFNHPADELKWVLANNFTHCEQIIQRWKEGLLMHKHEYLVRTIEAVSYKVLREEDV